MGVLDDIRRHFLENGKRLSDGWQAELSDEQKLELGQAFVAMAATLCWRDYPSLVHFFKVMEKSGIHILPTHFYSPLPVLCELDPAVYEKRYKNIPGLTFDLAAHRVHLEGISKFNAELDAYSDEPVIGHSSFYWNNQAFGKTDAAVYYSMLRDQKPDLVIEIGAGYSSFIALDAIEKNRKGKLICIDPFPMDRLRELARLGKLELIDQAVQSVDLATFRPLKQGDILFVDSSHVSKIGSDVNHILFEIVPLLPKGTHLHVHDIFFPWEVPRWWVEELNNFYNEQYIIMAFLMYNCSWNVTFSAAFAFREMREELSRFFPCVAGELSPCGSSLWLQRK